MSKPKKQKGNNNELIKKISFYGILISTILSIIGCIFMAFELVIGVVFVICGIFGFIVIFEMNSENSKYGKIIMEYNKEFWK